ncbi:MAG: aldo/keto reductase [Salinibacter sp.]
MDYRFFGRSGMKVSELCFGTQTFGWVTDEEDAHRMLDRFTDVGGNFFDTANKYNEGTAEEIFGKWIKARGRRSDYVIGSKVYFPIGDGPNETGLSRKHIMEAVEGSLRRLQTDYIDLYQMHCWDAATPIEETLHAMDDLIRQGKVRYIGASNFTPSQLDRAVMTSRMHDWNEISCLQAEYSLQIRSTEWELLPLCRSEGIALTAWSPLAGGWLSGKYQRNQPPPEDSRVGRGDRWDDQPEQRGSERTYRIIDTLLEISDEIDKTPAQIALNWLLQQPGVTAPIFGARTPDHLEDNLGAVGWQLSDQHVDQLNEASTLPLPSPHSFLANYTRQRPNQEIQAP